MKKNHFSSRKLYFFCPYKCFFIAFDYILSNFDALLDFWENPEIEDGGFSNHDVIIRHMASSLSVADFKWNYFVLSILLGSISGGGGQNLSSALPHPSPPPHPSAPQNKKPGLSKVKLFCLHSN